MCPDLTIQFEILAGSRRANINISIGRGKSVADVAGRDHISPGQDVIESIYTIRSCSGAGTIIQPY